MARAAGGLRARLGDVFLGRPLLRRLLWHARRISGGMDERLLLRVALVVLLITLVLSVLALLVEGRAVTIDALAQSSPGS
jgi:hypothetical protein